MHYATNIHCIHYADESFVFTRGDSISELTNVFYYEQCKVFKWLPSLCAMVEKIRYHIL